MMKRQWLQQMLAGAGLLVVTATAANAQIVQVGNSDSRNKLGLTVGGFLLRGEDGRANDDDVLLANAVDLVARDSSSTRLRPRDFNDVTFGAEYLFGVSDFLEVGAGAGFYQKTVPTLYRDLVNTNGREIEQDLKLRIVPVTATVRFLPLGRNAGAEPYVGAGVGIFNWRYSEIGEFVDDNDIVFSNVNDPFRASGTEVGPVLLAGIRVPVGAVALGGEVRWQKAKGDTGGFDEGFLGEKIDLGGTTVNFTLHFRF